MYSGTCQNGLFAQLIPMFDGRSMLFKTYKCSFWFGTVELLSGAQTREGSLEGHLGGLIGPIVPIKAKIS